MSDNIENLYPLSPLQQGILFHVLQEQGTGLFTFWDEPGAPGLAMTEVTVGAAALEWTAEDVTKAVSAMLALL